MEYLIPSDVARLVYGYLKGENCDKAANLFLETSTYLRECRLMYKKGCCFHTKVMGKSLAEMLDIFSEMAFIVDNYLQQKHEKLTETDVLSRLSEILIKGLPSNFPAAKDKKNQTLKGSNISKYHLQKGDGGISQFDMRFNQIDGKTDVSSTDIKMNITGVDSTEPDKSTEKGPPPLSPMTSEIATNQPKSFVLLDSSQPAVSSSPTLPTLVYSNTLFTLPVIGNFNSFNLMPQSSGVLTNCSYNPRNTLLQSTLGDSYRPILPKPSPGVIEVIVPELVPPPINEVAPVSVIPIKADKRKKTAGRSTKPKENEFEVQNSLESLLCGPPEPIHHGNIGASEQYTKTDSHPNGFITEIDPRTSFNVDTSYSEDLKPSLFPYIEDCKDNVIKNVPVGNELVKTNFSKAKNNGTKKKVCSEKSWDSDLRSYIGILPSPIKNEPVKQRKIVRKNRKKSQNKKSKSLPKNRHKKSIIKDSVKSLDSLLTVSCETVEDFDNSIQKSIDLYNSIVSNITFQHNSEDLLLQVESRSAANDPKLENLNLKNIDLKVGRSDVINGSSGKLSPECVISDVKCDSTISSSDEIKYCKVSKSCRPLNGGSVCYKNKKQIVSNHDVECEFNFKSDISTFKSISESKNVSGYTQSLTGSLLDKQLNVPDQTVKESDYCNVGKNSRFEIVDGIKNTNKIKKSDTPSNFSFSDKNKKVPIINCKNRVDDLLIKKCLKAVSSNLFTNCKFRKSNPLESDLNLKNRFKENKTIVKGRKSSNMKCSVNSEHSKCKNVIDSNSKTQQKDSLVFNHLEENKINIECNFESFDRISDREGKSSLCDLSLSSNISIKKCDNLKKNEKHKNSKIVAKKVSELLKSESVRIKTFTSKSQRRKRASLYNVQKHSQRCTSFAKDEENIDYLKVTSEKPQTEHLSQLHCQENHQDKLYFLKKTCDRLTNLYDHSQLNGSSGFLFDESSPMKGDSSYNYSKSSIDSVNSISLINKNTDDSDHTIFLSDSFDDDPKEKLKRKHVESSEISYDGVKKMR